MAYKLVASGTADDVRQLGDYQGRFPEGSRGYVELELRSELAANIIRWLDERLEVLGIPERKVVVEDRFLRIYFKTEVAPLVLIAGAIGASILLVALVVTWKLFKLEPAPVIGITVFVILAILAVIALIAIRGRLAAGPVKLGGGIL